MRYICQLRLGQLILPRNCFSCREIAAASGKLAARLVFEQVQKIAPSQNQKNSPGIMSGEFLPFVWRRVAYESSAATMRPAFIGVSRKRMPMAALRALPTAGTGGTIGTSPTPRTPYG